MLQHHLGWRSEESASPCFRWDSETKADFKKECRARNGTKGACGLPYSPYCRPIRGSGDWSVVLVVQGKAQWSRPCLLGAARIGQVEVDTGHARRQRPWHQGPQGERSREEPLHFPLCPSLPPNQKPRRTSASGLCPGPEPALPGGGAGGLPPVRLLAGLGCLPALSHRAISSMLSFLEHLLTSLQSHTSHLPPLPPPPSSSQPTSISTSTRPQV